MVLKSKVAGSHVSFPNRGLIFINEAGLNELILDSTKPACREFRQWVVGTVLPSIRKTGSYVAPQVESVVNTVAETTRLIDITVGDLDRSHLDPRRHRQRRHHRDQQPRRG
ncbi:Bro-N domain-containing protein [Cereibacter sphaeroides]|uniref:BRO-N domain-containing protein n=1 Tax=Cereibacter sphaeroides TaxID=1063 RepID=UPI001F1A4F6E|nr:BRO family protein [Cereibacter sphaeroides]